MGFSIQGTPLTLKLLSILRQPELQKGSSRSAGGQDSMVHDVQLDDFSGLIEGRDPHSLRISFVRCLGLWPNMPLQYL